VVSPYERDPKPPPGDLLLLVHPTGGGCPPDLFASLGNTSVLAS
jgi:hypothetical protein